jgi:hypothetical protein
VAYLDSGQSAELNWLVSPELSSLTLDDGAGPIDVLLQTIDGEGSIVVSPAATTTYTLIGTGSLGSESVEVEITVDEAAVINSFVSNVAEASPGSNITLVWDVANGSSVTIDNGIGAVDPVSGSVIVPVNEETTFTLTATNSQGPVTESVTITLADASLPVAHWRVGEAAGEKNGSVLIGEGGSRLTVSLLELHLLMSMILHRCPEGPLHQLRSMVQGVGLMSVVTMVSEEIQLALLLFGSKEIWSSQI